MWVLKPPDWSHGAVTGHHTLFLSHTVWSYKPPHTHNECSTPQAVVVVFLPLLCQVAESNFQSTLFIVLPHKLCKCRPSFLRLPAQGFVISTDGSVSKAKRRVALEYSLYTFKLEVFFFLLK